MGRRGGATPHPATEPSAATSRFTPPASPKPSTLTRGTSADIETAMNETLDSPPRLLPTDSSFPALSCRRQEVARWVFGHITGRWMPTPERIVAVSKGRHGVRPVAVTILCEIQRLRQNSVPIGALLALMLLTRLITRTGARYRRSQGLWFCFSSHHWQHCPPLVGSRRALVCAGRGRRIALQSDERTRCAHRA
jgi:hypothetical protein